MEGFLTLALFCKTTKMNAQEIINWLLDGDVSIQYQVHRDLLGTERKDLQQQIETEGWGKKLLSLRNSNGHWGIGFYQPKWTSSHYTLLDLKNLGMPQDCMPIKQTLEIILKENKLADGGVSPIGSIKVSDVCLNGMALNYFAYFKVNKKDLKSIVDFILSEQMGDGGFNCHSNRTGANHSSLHTTLSILEGILEYKNNKYTYRLNELLRAEQEAVEFILQHRLYKSDKTGKIIKKEFLRMPYPSRWRYDILRALDYFQGAKIKYDNRMRDSLDYILSKRSNDNTWKLQAHHAGARHLEMETVGMPSRWNHCGQ